MPSRIVPSVSFSRPDDNQKQDIHSVAERFLRDHLAKTGSKCETVQPVVARAVCAVESRSAAEGFLRQHLATRQTEAKRYEIEEPQQLSLVRRTGNVTSYFYGWKAQRPLFTHAQHLAQQFEPTESDKQVRMLQLCNIEVTALPAPETQRGSL
jgi:hypothetical protein